MTHSETSYPFIEDTKQKETAARNINQLVCFGCAHSIGAAEKPPSGPSGERPCFFCVRNPQREKWQEDHEKRTGKKIMEWYDGSPIAFYPMDAYQTLDMIEQQDRWERKAQGDPDWNESQGGIRMG